METYYDVLGVEKSATQDEIKKAYRKLVRQYHPDISKDKDAVEKSAKVNVAYETLKDKEKRAEYDAMLENPFGQGNAQGQSQDFSDFFRQYSQQRQEGGTNSFDQSEAFNHSDFSFDDIFSAFSVGQTHSQNGFGGSRRGEDQHAELSVDISAAYHGANRTISINVPRVESDGQIHYEPKTLNIKIPKGITEGQQIRLAKQGMPSHISGETGDLYLKIKFHESEDYFVKNGKDVYQVIDVAPWTVALGGKLTVDAPNGKLSITLPKNSAQGKTLRLKGKGIPCKEAGDLYVKVNIVLPKVNNDADEEAWKQLATHYDIKI